MQLMSVRKEAKESRTVNRPISTPKGTRKSTLSPNTQELWDHLKTVLNAKKFSDIKRTQVGVSAGLLTGSVAASFNKLLRKWLSGKKTLQVV